MVLALEATPRAAPPIPSGVARHRLPTEAAIAIEGWVQRTYVPASAVSRIAGAGAGLTDND
jgi:hypothetical protein